MPTTFRALSLDKTTALVVEVPAALLHDRDALYRMAESFREAIKQLCRLDIPLVMCAEGVKITALTDDQLRAFGLQRIPK